jgi:hypothetical protein
MHTDYDDAAISVCHFSERSKSFDLSVVIVIDSGFI